MRTSSFRLAPIGLLVSSLALGGCLLGPDESDCWDSSDEMLAEDGSTIAVDGQALRADGAPLSGYVLLEDPPTLEDLFGAVLTLGLTCLKEDLTGLDCSEYQQLALDGSGRFSLSVQEEDTVGTLGFDRTFLLFAGLPAGADGLARPSLVAFARFRKQHVKLPALRLWEPALALSAEGGALRVQLEEPPALECTTRQALALEFTDGEGHSFWSQQAGDLDARLLEDAHGALQARARFENTAWDRQVDTLELYSGAVPFAGTAGAPPSRGAACTLAGQSYPRGCPLTDGGMDLHSSPDGLAQVDLGSPRAVELVVLRGSFSSLGLSASLDGQSWTSLASGLTGGSLQVSPAQPLQTRFLKLQEGLGDYGQQHSLLLSEVSAW